MKYFTRFVTVLFVFTPPPPPPLCILLLMGNLEIKVNGLLHPNALACSWGYISQM